MKQWIDEQVEAGEITSSADYLCDLVAQDQLRRDKDRIAELRQIVDKALASGVSGQTTDQLFAEAVQIAKARGIRLG